MSGFSVTQVIGNVKHPCSVCLKGVVLKRKFGTSVGPAGSYFIFIYLNLYGKIGALVIITILYIC